MRGGHTSYLNMVVTLEGDIWELATQIWERSVKGTGNSECKSPKLITCLRPIPERGKR